MTSFSGLPELDQFGQQLGAALERDAPRRRRRRIGALGLLAAAAVAVPAAGAATDWAGLAGGQTALPTQVDPSLRVRLLGGTDALGPWRLEAYRAQLSSGGIGVCVFVSRDSGGTGRCLPEQRLGSLITAGQDPGVRIAAGVVTGSVAQVHVRLRQTDGRTRTAAVQPTAAPVGQLARLGLPEGLRPYALRLTENDASVQGVQALSQDSQVLAQDPPLDQETP